MNSLEGRGRGSVSHGDPLPPSLSLSVPLMSVRGDKGDNVAGHNATGRHTTLSSFKYKVNTHVQKSISFFKRDGAKISTESIFFKLIAS